MQISGKMIATWTWDEFKGATIELPEVDITKIKKGEKIWVEVEANIDKGTGAVFPDESNHFEIIAHFSQEKKDEGMKVPEKVDGYYIPGEEVESRDRKYAKRPYRRRGEAGGEGEMKKLRKNQLTIDDLVELICDVAYEQAIRDVSGGNWFNSFIEKIDRKNQKKDKVYEHI